MTPGVIISERDKSSRQVMLRKRSGSPVAVSAAPEPPSPSVVQDGLLFYLDAGNPTSYPGSGTTWTDLSGNGNNFTLVNSPTFVSNGAASAFSFVPESFHSADSVSSINLQRNWTLEGWINVNSFGGTLFTNIRAFFGQGAVVGGGGLSLEARNGSWYYQFYASDWDVPPGPTPGIWYHVAFTYVHTPSPYIREIYVNGVQLSNNDNYGQYGGTGVFRIGTGYSSDPFPGFSGGRFYGEIAVARGYSKVLTASEVLQNYNVEKSRYGY